MRALFGILFCSAWAASPDKAIPTDEVLKESAGEALNPTSETGITPNSDEQAAESDPEEDEKESATENVSGHCPCCGF